MAQYHYHNTAPKVLIGENMDEQNNINVDETVESQNAVSEDTQAESESQTPQTPHIDKKLRIFDVIYLAICSLFMLVMWCTGYNFLPLVANVLAIIAGVLIFARVLVKKNVGLYMWIAYMVCICGLFVFFLIWGAESFGKNLWYNLVLVLFPVLLATLVYVANRFISKQTALRVTCAVCAFLMVGTAIVYVFFMNLRCRPTVKSLQEGHDDYLKSVADRYKTNDDSPNVLFILMDDMAYSDISAYSYLGSENATINTPNIDSIADNGIMMDNFYSASPVCSPSRFSILTGRYSSRVPERYSIQPVVSHALPQPLSIPQQRRRNFGRRNHVCGSIASGRLPHGLHRQMESRRLRSIFAHKPRL